MNGEFTSMRGVPLDAVYAVLAEAQARPATAAELEPLKGGVTDR